eukprot:TRINITY_DN10077_c0_g1_i1.p1 TRINITY_DN10077_c0_g1~~TRINITY_DN10077_c0_g1_i1.p1  ORF type:complete len:521 (-),score=79.42 TRINITY_DN10077_c0_g1_i1:15-1349(-)
MSPTTFKEFTKALEENKSITSLDLRFCEIDDSMGKDVYNALLSKRPQTQLFGNNLSTALIKQFETLSNTSNDSIDSDIPTFSNIDQLSEDEVSMDLKLSPLTLKKPRSSSEEMNLVNKMNFTLDTSPVIPHKKSDVNNNTNNNSKTTVKEEEIPKGEGKLVRLGPKQIIINTENVQINERLAESGGSYACVYACLVDGWQCVMKELDLKDLNPVTVNHFEREITILEQLPYHPNIVRYLFHERKTDKLRLYVSRYSSSLRKVIGRKTEDDNFEMSEIAKICLEIATGLEFLHKHDIIHRDLKSDNIFVNLDAHKQLRMFAIGDFDTAKNVKAGGEAKTIIGTPRYMAPEVFNAQQQGSYTFKADVWSFGMILYELMTKMFPYENTDVHMVPVKVAAGERPEIPEDLEVEEELVKIFKKCTQLDPNKRPDITTLKSSFQRLLWDL